MIRVIRLRRRNIALALLALAGIVFCLLGFGGVAERLSQWRENPATSTSVGMEGEHQSGKSIGGGTPVEYTTPDTPEQSASNNGAGNNTGVTDSTDYFVEYRMERERARGMEMETMREVLASPGVSEEIRREANERLLRLSNTISKEMELENLIRARGYRDAAVFLDGHTVTVVVQEGDNTAAEEDHAGIVEMVAKNTGVDGDNIIVITRE